MNFATSIALCSIYISRSQLLSYQSLHDIFSQLPPPIIIMGDFNSYSQLWGCETTDVRGRTVVSVINHLNLNILNKGSSTRVSYGTESCIDLTIVLPRSEPITQWNVASSPNDRDHCPIKLDFIGNWPEEYVAERYNIKAAIWDLCRTNNAWDNIPVDISNIECENLLDDLYNRCDKAASASIPKMTIRKFFPKPYWTAQLTQSRNNREFFYEKYRHTKSARNIMLWKKI